jgi:RNA polymerase sigma-70 factor, ECF subfamily
MHAIALALPSPAPSSEYGRVMASLRDRLRGRSGPRADEAELVARLRAGDEDAFMDLVERLSPAMLRIARMHVRDRATAEEVVQETWLAVLNGIDRFEGRSSLRTWIFRILVNRAKTRGERDGRVIPFSSVASADAAAGDEPAVEADRFLPADHPSYPYGWAAAPLPWTQERVLERETLQVVKDAIAQLPETQREVIRLRDVEGWSPEEVASALEITDGNQRVLLHRARSKVRAALEAYLNPEIGTA